MRWLLSIVLFSLASLFAPMGAMASKQPRIALVIANQNYTQPGAALANTFRDADLVKAALQKVGFQVWLVRDTVNEGALMSAIGEHVQRLSAAGPEAIGFLYYTGHGAADRPDGVNYLIPTAEQLTHASHLPLMAVRLDRITSALASVGKINFVIFDACRNVPLIRDTKDFTFKGFAPIQEQSGMLVAYATEPGNVAVDQSIYARALAEEIVVPGHEAGQAFRAVTRRVLAQTGRKQRPEYLDKRLYDFEFAAAVPVPPTPPDYGPFENFKAMQSVSKAPGVAKTGPDVGDKAETERWLRSLASSFRTDPAKSVEPGSGRSFRDCPDCPEMVVVPHGSFMMGSNDGLPTEKPVHKVTISRPFAAGKFEVTFAEWDACVADGGCSKKPETTWGRGQQPVHSVSWDDATQQYLPWLSRKTGKKYRLLSEAEWEYVARAGTTTKFYWGNDFNRTKARSGNVLRFSFRSKDADPDDRTAEVGQYKPNSWGTYDMIGNVDEWVQDCWHDTFENSPRDGSSWSNECAGRTNLRVVRGGSWIGDTGHVSSASRGSVLRNKASNDRGFRVGRTITP